MSNLICFFLNLAISGALIYSLLKLKRKWPLFMTSILGKLFKGAIVLIISLTLVATIIFTFNYAHNYWKDDRVRVLNEIEGVKLGWSRDEVLFRKGKPTTSKQRLDGEFLTYDDDQTGFLIVDNKVDWIEKNCSGYSYDKVGGVACGDSLDRVIDLYGQPKRLEVSEDKLSRLYCYAAFHVCYEVSLAKVNSIILVIPKDGDLAIHFTTAAEKKMAESQEKAIENKLPPLPKGATLKEDVTPESDGDGLKKIKQKPTTQNASSGVDDDHCAPGLSRSERLRRLALKGAVRETGKDTYSVGYSEIMFSYDGSVLICR